MKGLRLGLAAIVMLGLTAGYFASQMAFLNNEAPGYAARVDTPLFKTLSLVVLVAIAALGFVREKKEEEAE